MPPSKLFYQFKNVYSLDCFLIRRDKCFRARIIKVVSSGAGSLYRGLTVPRGGGKWCVNLVTVICIGTIQVFSFMADSWPRNCFY